jgi:hypothetical protein
MEIHMSNTIVLKIVLIAACVTSTAAFASDGKEVGNGAPAADHTEKAKDFGDKVTEKIVPEKTRTDIDRHKAELEAAERVLQKQNHH